MSKFWRFMMVLALLGLFVAACSGGEEPAPAPAEPAAEEEAAEPAEEAASEEAASEEEAEPAEEAAAPATEGLEELNVAYFLEWPTANQVAQVEQTYDEVLGIPVNWIPFPSGNDMALAMEAGDIDISYSQGLTPFANFVTSGADHVIVGVAVSYADADNCVAHPDFGVTADNAAEALAGQNIYTPIGNVTHFKLLKMLQHLGVDLDSISLIPSEGGPAAVAAFENGDVAMACAFGGAVNNMLAAGGNLVMTGSEQEAIGIRVFDIISAPRSFADEYPEVVSAFLQVTEDSNAAYAADRASAEATIAEAAGMDLDGSNALLDAFSFLDKDTQLSDAWLGGTVQAAMKEQMDFFVEQGEIPEALDSYDGVVDTSYLEAVSGGGFGTASPKAGEAMEAMGPMETPDELNVAYFLEWPTANQVAQVEQTYDEVLGIPVNWIPFPSGNDMALAMEAGDIDISYSQGLTPFANFVTSGADHVIVGVAVSYADADNCVAHPDYGVTADNAAEALAGQNIYTPIGNVTHFKLLKMLQHLGVDLDSVSLIPSEGGPAAVAAFENGDVAMACAFGGAVNNMLAAGGNLVMTGSEQEAIGIRVFDIISAPRSFAEQYPDVVKAFLQVTEDSNAAYAADRASAEATIAEAAGMDLDGSNALLDAFSFLDKDTQLSDAWLGGTVQAAMKEQMDFFVEQGEIPEALDSYDGVVDTSYLAAVSGGGFGTASPKAGGAAMEEEAMGPLVVPDELNVAYFLEWPTANQVAQVEQTYDEVLGIPVNWIPFPSGNDMALAMEAGDIDISYSQGLTPFANFVTSGADHVIVGVAVSYADADNCVAHPDYGVTADNAAESLAGQNIYTPIGNVTHFKLLKMLQHLGVDLDSVSLIPSEGGPAAVAAFENGDVAMACAFGGAVNNMLAAGGNLVMTGSEQEAIGIRVFDIISAPRSFTEAYPDAVTAFLQVTEDANSAYAADRASKEATIAEAAGMDLDGSNALLDAFNFPDKDTQLSDAWLGGTVQQVMKDQMDFFVEQGEIPEALDSYDAFVDTSFLEGVK